VAGTPDSPIQYMTTRLAKIEIERKSNKSEKKAEQKPYPRCFTTQTLPIEADLPPSESKEVWASPASQLGIFAHQVQNRMLTTCAEFLTESTVNPHCPVVLLGPFAVALILTHVWLASDGLKIKIIVHLRYQTPYLTLPYPW